LPLIRTLVTGTHYWFRQLPDPVWRIGYIGEDPDGKQWLHMIGIDPIKVSYMNLNLFQIKKVSTPDPSTIDPDEEDSRRGDIFYPYPR
jgi:hypothetical protein